MGNVEKLTNSTTGGPVFVYVQDGRIIRVTPMEFDTTDGGSWTIKAKGKSFSPRGGQPSHPTHCPIVPWSIPPEGCCTL